MKDLIISAVANYEPNKIHEYIKSIDRCGFSGDKKMVCYNLPDETVHFLKLHGWECYGFDLNRQHPHMKRLIDMYSVIKLLDTEYRFIITTDVRDVVFQTNPSDYLESNLKKKILVSSENVLYKHESWGEKNIKEGYGELLWEHYKHNPTCNVGVLAGHSKELTELLLLNYLVSQSGNTEHFTDQSSFNFIIGTDLLKDSVQIEGLETNWALQMGTLDNPNLIGMYNESVKDNIIYHNDAPYVIVHQYDRIPNINKIITTKYN